MRHHQVFVGDVDLVEHAQRFARLSPLAIHPLDGVQDGTAGIQVHRVAEFVRLGRGDRFNARRVIARVVPAQAALAERPEQIAQGAVAQEIQALVGHFKAAGRRVRSCVAAGSPRAQCACRLQVRGRRDEALFHHPIDDVLNELLQLRARIPLIRVRRISHQPLERLLRQHAAVEQRVHDGVVQRLHGAIVFGVAVHAVEGRMKPARQEQIRQLLDQIVQIQIVQRVARVFRVLVFHV